LPLGVAADYVPRVRFPAEQTLQHDSEIVIESAGDGTFNVHLGFLQICHRYEIKFAIKDDAGQDLTFDPLQNLNVAIMDVVPSDDGMQF